MKRAVVAILLVVLLGSIMTLSVAAEATVTVKDADGNVLSTIESGEAETVIMYDGKAQKIEDGVCVLPEIPLLYGLKGSWEIKQKSEAEYEPLFTVPVPDITADMPVYNANGELVYELSGNPYTTALIYNGRVITWSNNSPDFAFVLPKAVGDNGENPILEFKAYTGEAPYMCTLTEAVITGYTPIETQTSHPIVVTEPVATSAPATGNAPEVKSTAPQTSDYGFILLIVGISAMAVIIATICVKRKSRYCREFPPFSLQ